MCLFITEVPGPPQNPAVSDVCASSAHLSWETPESDGGAPITGYFVERRQTSSSRWLRVTKQAVPADTLSFDDKELIEDTEYEYRVLAVNKIGEGPPCSPTAPFVAKDPWGKDNGMGWFQRVINNNSFILATSYQQVMNLVQEIMHAVIVQCVVN